jgi:hypothetical protein
VSEGMRGRKVRETRTGRQLRKEPRTTAHPHACDGQSVRKLALRQWSLQNRVELVAKIGAGKVGDRNSVANVEDVEFIGSDEGRAVAGGGDHGVGEEESGAWSVFRVATRALALVQCFLTDVAVHGGGVAKEESTLRREDFLVWPSEVAEGELVFDWKI